jgi:hypothetical protein
MIGLFLSLCISLLTGFLFVAPLWRCKHTFRCHALIKYSIGIGVGLGLSSFISILLLLMLGYQSKSSVILADIFVMLGSYLFFINHLRTKDTSPTLCNALPTDQSTISSPWMRKILWGGFVVSLYSALLIFVQRSMINQHGEWDAWAIWNNHARFIFEGGKHWTNIFSPDLVGTHADYPWLLPSLVARSWMYMGNSSVIAPISIAFLYTFSTVLLLMGGIFALQKRRNGLLAATVLLSTPFYIVSGASQYADIPLSYYFLATFVLTTLSLYSNNTHILSLVGATIGMALFTKNEGLLFFIVYSFPMVIFLRKVYLRFFIMILPFLIVNLFVKTLYAPPNDLFYQQTVWTMLPRLTSLERYKQVFVTFLQKSFTFASFPVDMPLLLLLFPLVTGVPIEKKGKKAKLFMACALATMLIGYFFIYMLSPRDLAWHLQSSLDRLFIQLWPSILFLLFLLVE